MDIVSRSSWDVFLNNINKPRNFKDTSPTHTPLYASYNGAYSLSRSSLPGSLPFSSQGPWAYRDHAKAVIMSPSDESHLKSIPRDLIQQVDTPTIITPVSSVFGVS